ncbi:hypothetical protein AAHE18_13G309100 [Arachis hypogaea]
MLCFAFFLLMDYVNMKGREGGRGIGFCEPYNSTKPLTQGICKWEKRVYAVCELLHYWDYRRREEYESSSLL